MLKKLFSDSLLYGLSSILARIINYALVPLHTSVLSAQEYGTISEFYAYAAFLNVIYTYGMETAYFRFTSLQEQEPSYVFRQILTLLIFSTLLFSSLLYFNSATIASWIGNTEKSIYVEWFSCILAIDTLMVIPFAHLRYQQKAKQFALLKILNILLNVGLNYLFLWFLPHFYSLPVFYNDKIGIVFASNLLANLCWIPFFFPLLKDFRFYWNSSLVQKLFKYGIPILFSGIAFAINEVADRILLKYWLPHHFYLNLNAEEAVGIYSACYKLSIFITLTVQAYRFAAEPFFFAKASDKNSFQYYADSMYYFTLICATMLLGIGANLDWIALLFLKNPIYRQGLEVVSFLLLGNVALGIYYNLSVWYKITNQTYWGVIFSGVAAIFTLVGNYALIPLLGYLGSAITTAVAYTSMAVSCFWIGKKYMPIPYRWTFPLSILLISFLVSVVLHFAFESFTLKTIIGNLLWALVVLILYLKEKDKLLS
ncbi:MAG: polysaccharide biosynthesis C-terminal domain-containing protein [Cytophagales bacterium]|nr:polysaccharide biosynthesis C-terminal domain-containing protein [Cytophagales bacterium]MDW8384957.1 polysaccharide biosynthesis C-terminal domain-containing protein [Flammeovirgaceae bacterium]